MDKITPTRRSANMRAIRAKDTAPEVAVRRALRIAGFTGYRLHRKDLPGRPDIAFLGRREAIFVHGCFWHGHHCAEGLRRPRSRLDYWLPKIAGNQVRDARHLAELEAKGWRVLVLWDCELRGSGLTDRLESFCHWTLKPPLRGARHHRRSSCLPPWPLRPWPRSGGRHEPLQAFGLCQENAPEATFGPSARRLPEPDAR